MKDLLSLAILVVDDSVTMRKLISGMLQQLGVRSITEAVDGQTALDEIAAFHSSFDLIISDWQMSPMDGLQLLKQVKHLRRPSNYRFIFITSETSWGIQTTAKMEGAQAFLAKPFNLQTLKRKIEVALS